MQNKTETFLIFSHTFDSDKPYQWQSHQVWVSLHFGGIWPTGRRKRFSFHPLTFTTLWSNNDRISKNCRKKECRNKSVFCPCIKYKDSVNVFVLCLVVTQKIISKCITSKIGLCVKFIYSEKATQFCEISTVDLTATT